MNNVAHRPTPAAIVAAKCFDVSIAVSCRPEDADIVSAHLPLGSARIDPAQAEHRFVLYSHDGNLFSVRRVRSTNSSLPQPLTSALKALQKELYLCIAEHAQRHVFVHAGVVAWKNRVLIFPGSSYAGKSTLVWSFVQSGAVYYSDEYAVFDEQGRVSPFALPINLRVSNGQREMIMPGAIGTSRLKPDLVIFARYRPEASWRPRSLAPAETVMHLIRHSIAIRANPALVIPVLKHVSLQSRAFQGTRGEPHELLAWINCIDRLALP
jgi:hypothetical protein